MWGVAATNGVYSCGSEMAQIEGFSDAWMAVSYTHLRAHET
jgi:hypothetical protein